MSQVIVAKRYADALFQLANEQNLTDQFIEELEVVKATFEQNEKLSFLLSSPNVTVSKKTALIDEAFAGVHTYIKNELKILIQRRRSNSIIHVIDEFTNLYNEKNDIAHAIVTSARELTETEATNVETTFKSLLNKKSLTIENKVDASLLGGLRIRIGNTIYDGSVSGKLKRIEQELLTASK